MISKLYRNIAIITSIILGFIWAYFKGKSSGKQEEKFNQMKENEKTRKRMDEADIISSDDELYDVLHKNKF